MYKKEEVFKRELIWLDKSFQSQDQLFSEVSEKLYKEGYVKSDFYEALKKREKVYPTGLMTEKYGVAIPHTDAEYINEACIVFIRLSSPIIFEHMGEPEKKVKAHFVFVLGVKDPKKQVGVLSTLVQMITDKELMKKLDKMKSIIDIERLLNSFFDEPVQEVSNG